MPRNEEIPLAIEIQRTEEEIHIYEGLAIALHDAHAVLDVVLESEDPDSAEIALRDRLGLDGVQVRAVMDLQFRRGTQRDRERIGDRRRELTEHLAYLRDLDRR